jgi:succinyl-CoA synthetase beta subunit
VEIEEVAASSPEKILAAVDPASGIEPFHAAQYGWPWV